MALDVSMLCRACRLPKDMFNRPVAKHVLDSLANYCQCNGDGVFTAFPSVTTMAQEAEVGSKRTIDSHLQALQRRGLISEYAAPKQHRPREWRLHLDKIAMLVEPATLQKLIDGWKWRDGRPPLTDYIVAEWQLACDSGASDTQLACDSDSETARVLHALRPESQLGNPDTQPNSPESQLHNPESQLTGSESQVGCDRTVLNGSLNDFKNGDEPSSPSFQTKDKRQMPEPVPWRGTPLIADSKQQRAGDWEGVKTIVRHHLHEHRSSNGNHQKLNEAAKIAVIEAAITTCKTQGLELGSEGDTFVHRVFAIEYVRPKVSITQQIDDWAKS